MDANMSLLDAMAVQAGCEFLSDLRYIDDLQRLRLARALEKVSPQSGTKGWQEEKGGICT